MRRKENKTTNWFFQSTNKSSYTLQKHVKGKRENKNFVRTENRA